MRISNERYSRDLQGIELALRMLKHEARTKNICAWTGLSAARVRNLSRSYSPSKSGVRHRGPAPSCFTAVMTSPVLRPEAAAVAGLCRWLDVLPSGPCLDPRRTLPGLARGERLCDAFELFQHIIPLPRLTLDQWVLLVLTVADGETWRIEGCTNCQATILTDRLGVWRRLCAGCQPRPTSRPDVAGEQSPAIHPAEWLPSDSHYVQESLF
jgi:hypothetical protein